MWVSGLKSTSGICPGRIKDGMLPVCIQVWSCLGPNDSSNSNGHRNIVDQNDVLKSQRLQFASTKEEEKNLDPNSVGRKALFDLIWIFLSIVLRSAVFTKLDESKAIKRLALEQRWFCQKESALQKTNSGNCYYGSLFIPDLVWNSLSWPPRGDNC